jgi:hypothetical protein
MADDDGWTVVRTTAPGEASPGTPRRSQPSSGRASQLGDGAVGVVVDVAPQPPRPRSTDAIEFRIDSADGGAYSLEEFRNE